MREIKFRGKCKDDGEWVYGYAVKYLTGRFNIYEPVKSSVSEDDVYQYEVSTDTVGQFAGLHDKNGIPIYEGDIIDFGLNAVVKYHPFLCSFILDCDNREPHLNDSYSELGFMEKTSKKFVVIGNIHDTPELLDKIAEQHEYRRTSTEP